VNESTTPSGCGTPDPIGRFLEWLCKAFAIGSGVVLLAMASMSLISIAGRALVEQPLLGDYELVQMMSAAAVSMTLPYAHWAKAHVIVDFFTTRASHATRLVLDSLAGLLMSLSSGVMCWRLAVGLLDLKSSQDSSMLLGLPTWWGYVAMVPSFGLLSLCAAYITLARLRRGTR
jgi:TRAP-type C4-dicarboxylate transport system permease small subunit